MGIEMSSDPKAQGAPVPESRSSEDHADIWDVAAVVRELADVRRNWREINAQHIEYGSESYPSRVRISKVIEELSGALFPMRLGPDFVRPHNEDTFVTQTLQIALSRLHAQLRLELTYAQDRADGEDVDAHSTRIVIALSRQLPEIRRLLDLDMEAAFRGDPSARSLDEVLICFPGMLAIIHHRVAHALYNLGVPLVARIIAELSHSRTGIDLHPGARIGEGFFIDHGTGAVIGETAIIGNNVRIYQGVTLGAKNFPIDPNGALIKALPRHPVIENNVVIYAGATILGRVTIGEGSEIGGNVWLTHDVPPFSRVYQAREQNLVIRANGDLKSEGAHNGLL
jgi:serine O-acetyltransferase